MASIAERAVGALFRSMNAHTGWNGYASPIGTIGHVSTTNHFDAARSQEQALADLSAAVHQTDSVIAAAVAARAMVLGEYVPRWRSMRDGHLFGDQALAPLEDPGYRTRSDLIRRAEHDVSYVGTAYFYRDPRGWITTLPANRMRAVLATSVTDLPAGFTIADMPDAEVIGYRYNLNDAGDEWIPFNTSEVSHWAPEPDPQMGFLGVSWIVSLLSEITADRALSSHVTDYLENGAMGRMAVVWDDQRSEDELREYENMLGQRASGDTLVLAGGATVQQVTADIDRLGVRELSGQFETRVSVRSRVPAVVLGIKESLQGSALTTGNYGAARRLWADGWVTPTLRSLCQALQPLLAVPDATELYFDPERILFLQEDAQDAATINSTKISAVRQAIEAGFEPDAAVRAADTGDLDALMGAHTGLSSVQLQPPDDGTGDDDPPPTDSDDDDGDDDDA